MTGFQEAFKDLNPEQKRAVEHIDGPLLVLAGPGTGKTQLIALRAAQILKATDSAPENILCLTFTNKAATNMRERLYQLVGHTARGIVVKTFHSFAAEIMNRYPDYFWSGARLTSVPDVLKLELVESTLAELPLKHPLALKFAGQYTLVSDTFEAIKLAKEAGLTPEKLRAIIDFNLRFIDVIEPRLVDVLEPRLSAKQLEIITETLAELPETSIDDALAPLSPLGRVINESFAIALEEGQSSGKNTSLSKWKTRWIQTIDGVKCMADERRRNEWWRGVADVYENYRDKLNARGFYDYADMVIEVISALEREPELRASVQEQFTHVMIDEFQDANAAQGRLSHLVADHHLNDRPNIMAVGDDDQSIFKFQGAELNTMLEFKQSYSAEVIVLERNYRSSQAVLDSARAVIEKARYRLVTMEDGISKNLVAVNNGSKGLIRHDRYKTMEHELSSVTKTISSLHKQGSVAVLARGHESLKRIAAQLIAAKIPIRYEQQSNIIDDEIVRLISTLSEVVLAIHDGDINLANAGLSEALRHPAWRIPARDLWDISILNQRQSNWLETMLDSDDEHLSAIGHWLLFLSQQADSEPLAVMIEYLLGLRAGEHLTSPILDYFKRAPDKLTNQYLQNLSAVKLMRSLSLEFGGRSATLRDFWDLFKSQLQNDRVVADETAFVSGVNTVELMTVHKAKGLEFDSVVIIDASEQNWSPGISRRKPPANLPLQPHGDDDDDYARLMYVAVSRARKNVIITSHSEDEQGREVLATPLILDGFPENKIESPNLDANIKILETSLAWPRLESSQEKFLLAPRLEGYRLSATGLLTFVDVISGGPIAFFEQHLLRLPGRHGPKQSFGLAVHKALEAGQVATNRGKFSLGSVITAYEAALGQESLTNAEYERYLLHGQDVLRRLFGSMGFKLNKGALPERALGDASIGEVKLTGKLDLLRVDKKGLSITDYKTGKAISSLHTKAKQGGIKAWKHRTQLTFYALLASLSPGYEKLQIEDTSVIYVESETKKQLEQHFVPTQQDLDYLTALTERVWQKIMALDFPDVSSYEQSVDGIQQFCDDLISNSAMI